MHGSASYSYEPLSLPLRPEGTAPCGSEGHGQHACVALALERLRSCNMCGQLKSLYRGLFALLHPGSAQGRSGRRSSQLMGTQGSLRGRHEAGGRMQSRQGRQGTFALRASVGAAQINSASATAAIMASASFDERAIAAPPLLSFGISACFLFTLHGSVWPSPFSSSKSPCFCASDGLPLGWRRSRSPARAWLVCSGWCWCWCWQR